MNPQPDQLRRGMLGSVLAVLAGALMPTRAEAADVTGGPALKVRRIVTKGDMTTTLEDTPMKNDAVQRGESTLVPAGCIRHMEGPALAISIGYATLNQAIVFRNCPNQRHNLTFTLAGSCDVTAKDGKTMTAVPGDWMSAEDVVGGGHSANYPESGFLRLSLQRPSNDMKS